MTKEICSAGLCNEDRAMRKYAITTLRQPTTEKHTQETKCVMTSVLKMATAARTNLSSHKQTLCFNVFVYN